jgi:hypothetical protein
MILRVEFLAVVELRRGMSRLFMNPKIQSWNVRGLNKGDKCLRVCHLLRWKVDVVCL